MEGNEIEKAAAYNHIVSLYGKCRPNDHPDNIRIESFTAGANWQKERENAELTRTSKELDEMTTKYNELSRKYDDLYRKHKPL